MILHQAKTLKQECSKKRRYLKSSHPAVLPSSQTEYFHISVNVSISQSNECLIQQIALRPEKSNTKQNVLTKI